MATFEELVAKDVRGEANEGEKNILKNDISEWLIILNTLKRDVELQLAAQKVRLREKAKEHALDKDAWHTYKSEEDQWRLRVLRFNVSVERRIQQVKKLRKLNG